MSIVHQQFTVLDSFPSPTSAVSIPQQGANRNLRNIRSGSSLRCVLPGLGPPVITRADGFHIIMFLSVCDVSRLAGQNSVLRLLWGIRLPGQHFVSRLSHIVSPDKSSPDEQWELGSYSSLAFVKCTFLVKLDFDLTLTYSVVWTWVDVRCSVNEVLNKTSFGIEFASWFTIDRQSRSTSRLRMVTGLFFVLSVTVNRSMISIHSRSCLSTSLS